MRLIEHRTIRIATRKLRFRLKIGWAFDSESTIISASGNHVITRSMSPGPRNASGWAQAHDSRMRMSVGYPVAGRREAAMVTAFLKRLLR